MPLDLVLHDANCDLYHGDSVAERLPCEVDALIVDAPYSERTHAAFMPESHDGYARPDGRVDHPGERRRLNYDSWSRDLVTRAVASWAPMVRGWFVTITDHDLAPAWSAALEETGRYVFAPLPFLSPGSRVRLAGDGPSTWVCWIVVARPRKPPFSKWGTLPGGYVVPPGDCGSGGRTPPIVGGKPLRLMTALVQDYSRPGDLVCDPCMGAGTTIRAAVDTGRRGLGIDIDRAHVDLAVKRMRQQVLPGLEVAP